MKSIKALICRLFGHRILDDDGEVYQFAYLYPSYTFMCDRCKREVRY